MENALQEEHIRYGESRFRDKELVRPFVNRIYQDITELEALQQPKSCAKCKAFKLDDEHNDGFGQCFWGIHFPNGNSSSYHKGTDFYCSEFEAKEQ